MENSFDVEKDVVPFVTFLSGYDHYDPTSRLNLFTVGIKLLSGNGNMEELKCDIYRMAYLKMGKDVAIGEYNRIRLFNVGENQLVVAMDISNHPKGLDAVIDFVSIINIMYKKFTLELFRYTKVMPGPFIKFGTEIEISDNTSNTHQIPIAINTGEIEYMFGEEKLLCDIVEANNTMIGLVLHSKEGTCVSYVNSISMSFGNDELTEEKFEEIKTIIFNSIETGIHERYHMNYDYCKVLVSGVFKVYKVKNNVCLVHKMKHIHSGSVLVTEALIDLSENGYNLFDIKRIEDFAEAVEWVTQDDILALDSEN